MPARYPTSSEDDQWRLPCRISRYLPDRILVLVTALSEASKDVADSLRKLGFEKIDVSGLSGTPAEALSELRSRITTLSSEAESIRAEIATLADLWRISC